MRERGLVSHLWSRITPIFSMPVKLRSLHRSTHSFCVASLHAQDKDSEGLVSHALGHQVTILTIAHPLPQRGSESPYVGGNEGRGLRRPSAQSYSGSGALGLCL